jgi:hypothetical protein
MPKLVRTEQEIEQITRDTYESLMPGQQWADLAPDAVFNKEFFIRWTRVALSAARDSDG